MSMLESERITLRFDLKPKEPFTVFALQIGGYLPLCFTGANIALMDRNIISNVENILANGNNRNNKANAWWFEFINKPNIALNPALAALEGKTKKQLVPSFDEFRHEFDRCSQLLTRAFPNSRVVSYSDEAYCGAFNLFIEASQSYRNEIRFLTQAAPLLVHRNSRNDLERVEAEILDLSKSSGLRRPTLSLIACLSCLYEHPESKQKSPGRLVLKPKIKYTPNMAHNSIMDIFAISILIQGNAKLNSDIALCTCDKGLLRFWLALGVNPGGSESPSGFTFSMQFTEHMFPVLTDDQILDLKSRIECFHF